MTATIDDVMSSHSSTLTLPADRTAGDEFQVLTADPRTALQISLTLTRTTHWSVGMGIGSVRMPLPSSTREANGDAFYRARDAVTRAKRSHTRFALTGPESGTDVTAADAQALVDLLIALRERRTDSGWALFDLLETGITQADAAARLGITPGAASLRAKSGGIRIEAAATVALVKLLDTIDRSLQGAS